jgi:predicted ArsR family transcriptional regulator
MSSWMAETDSMPSKPPGSQFSEWMAVLRIPISGQSATRTCRTLKPLCSLPTFVGRHLTTQQKREVIAKLLKANPEKSNRQIAGEVKVSHPTVAAVRADLETKGDVEKISTSLDKKGRRQPIHKTTAKKQSRTQRSSRPDVVSPAEPKDMLQRVDDLADQIQDVAESLEPQDRAGFFEAIRQEIDTIEHLFLDAPEVAKSAEAADPGAGGRLG